jgi:hypothetical protein
MSARRYPTHPSDIRRLRGIASVCVGRDHSDGSPIYRVAYTSGGGDISFLSAGTPNEDHAHAGARLLAEFVGGTTTAESVRNPHQLEGAREVQFATA